MKKVILYMDRKRGLKSISYCDNIRTNVLKRIRKIAEIDDDIDVFYNEYLLNVSEIGLFP
jgi:hypothetical protein